MKKILVHIYHTASELDVLLPIFLEIKNTRKIAITFIFSEKNVYQKYLEDEIARECVKRLGIKILPLVALQWTNKVPGRDKPALRFLYRVSKFIEQLVYLPLIVFLVLTHDVYMHEITKYTNKTYLFYLLRRLNGNKKIYAYPHATALNYFNNYSKKISDSNLVTLLAFDEKSGLNYKKLGYDNQYIIGFPKFFNGWVKYLSTFDSGYQKGSYVVIYSRSIHAVYMDPDIYRFLYESVYRAIRNKFGTIKIVVKLHPREDKSVFDSIVRKNAMENIELSTLHPGVLAKDAVATISFYTSAILDALAFSVPSVEYYIESMRFRESETEGSVYKLIGIDSVDSEDALNGFFDKIISGTYVIPQFIRTLSQFKYIDVNFIN